MTTVYKLMNVSVKQIGEESDRTLRFIVTNETQDRDDDILDFDGWDTTNFQNNPVGLYMHRYDTPPMARATNIIMDSVQRQIIIDYQFPTLEQMASDPQFASEHSRLTDTIYNMYKNGFMHAVSVGFRPFDFESIEGSAFGRRYTEQELLEVSFVSVPSNPQALQLARSKGIINEDMMKTIERDIQEVEETYKQPDKVVEKVGSQLNRRNRRLLQDLKEMFQNGINTIDGMLIAYMDEAEERQEDEDEEDKASRQEDEEEDKIEEIPITVNGRSIDDFDSKELEESNLVDPVIIQLEPSNPDDQIFIIE